MAITVEEAKEKGRRVQTRLRAFGHAVKLGQALELVATVYGDANWHALRARLTAVRSSAGTRRYMLFEVKLFRTDDDVGSSEHLATVSVVARTAEQATTRVFEEYWYPQYDQAHFYPTYEVDSEPYEFGLSPAFVASWLAAGVQWETTAAARSARWHTLRQFFARHGVDAERLQLDAPGALAEALKTVAVRFRNGDDFLDAVHSLVPAGYCPASEDREDFFMCVGGEDEFVFANVNAHRD